MELLRHDVQAATERRMARMIIYSRAGTTAFLLVPLVSWDRLALPWAAVCVALLAAVEAVWFAVRAWRGGTLHDPALVWADVLVSVVVMTVGSRAALPHERNVVLTALLPFCLATSAVLGFGFGWSRRAVASVAVLAAAWTVSIYPNLTQKLVSDLLGFTLWFLIAVLIGRELRDLAGQTVLAQRLAEERQELLAEYKRRQEAMRQRESAHRAIHDDLLPIVERVAGSPSLDPPTARAARRAAQRARRFITDEHATAFADLMAEVAESAADLGLELTHVLRVHHDPPPEVGEVLASAAREALNNVARHAGEPKGVHLYAAAADDGVTVVVRDRGRGLPEGPVRRGGGMSRSFAAVERHGGSWTIERPPGGGTKVVLRWPEGRE
ncbi:sensor histidine kinase [Streptosporangium saharense]|uniref:Signal transduction histidine kinase n=1 Tax=Streptosporangium saharense TaxID=1706840 RepID=A0A7W7QIL4_9ACTN|nr:ATP-binding protein [Streptosporangium saharense]MBB4914229.1 signal transduction histidine kinase [Streptosporangium saharense]